MDDAQAIAMSLWVFHTHVIDAADYTPYIYVTSAEKESGKSRLKEAVELLVLNPILTSNVSPPVLFRLASPEDGPPATFLVDEVDEIFSPKSERSELRGLLNAGFHRGDHAIRMVGEGAKQFPRKFPVFCAKLLAGKNSAALGDTLESRCIRIELKRKTREEQVERFRRREIDEHAIYAALQSLGSYYVDELAAARPRLPEELSDRQQDIWEPLLAIAELADEGWAERGRAAAVSLFTGRVDDESLGVHLLADTREVFDGLERISTARLIELLCLIEEAPWGEKWWDSFKGEAKKGAAANLAWHLRRYKIHSKKIRFEEGPLPGFERSQFEDSWTRYVPLTPSNPEQPQEGVEGVNRMPLPETSEGKPLPPGLGDEMYPVLLANAVRDGHITEREAEERYALHKLVLGEGKTPARPTGSPSSSTAADSWPRPA
jgi:hypothetical protein